MKVDVNLRYRVAINLVLAEKLKQKKKIEETFSSLAEVFQASERDLITLGVDKKRAKILLSGKILNQAEKEIERSNRNDYTILTIEDSRYPDYLRETFDPPFVLYCAGRVESLGETSVSIVGARKPTPYGRAVAERIAQDLAHQGIVIVSGLARGIDSIAHWGALKGGKTVAVLGSGLNNIYPRENRKLFEKIIENGAVVTEYPLTSPPLGAHFPQRNRIISGLSLALVVVEATKRSGSLISARLALEQNREVMAVPGNITSETSQGANWLIKTGAKLIQGWEDVVEEFPSPIKEEFISRTVKKEEKPPDLNPQEKELFNLIPLDSVIHIDTLVEESQFSVSEALSLLLSLELKDLIIQNPGKYFQRKL